MAINKEGDKKKFNIQKRLEMRGKRAEYSE